MKQNKAALLHTIMSRLPEFAVDRYDVDELKTVLQSYDSHP